MPMPEDAALGAIYQRVMDRWIAAGDASRLSADDQDFIAIATLLNENANGSLSQYFENSYGDFAARAVRALARIGCAEASECVRKAIAMLNCDAPESQTCRGKRIEAMSEAESERLFKLSEWLEEHESLVWQTLARQSRQWTV